MSTLVALAAGPAAAASTQRYVNVATGSDTVPAGNQCTNIAQPCKTIARAITVSVLGQGDVINVAPGTYLERVVVTKDVTINGSGQGANPAVDTIIDANASSGSPASVVVTNPGAGRAVTINAVRLTRGFASLNGGFGGGLQVLTGAASLNSSTVTGNQTMLTGAAGFGGGIYVNASTTFTGSNLSIRSNSARQGAGMYVAGTASVGNSTIASNSAPGTGVGGGVATGLINSIGARSLTLTASVVDQNVAFSGGGLYNTGSAIVSDTAFTKNGTAAATLLGGGVVNAGGASLMMSSGAIADSNAISGGGLWNLENGTASVTGTSITGNKATAVNANQGVGGGVLNGGVLTLTSATVTGNSATPAAGQPTTGFGGGIYNASSSAPAGVQLNMSGGSISTNTGVNGAGLYSTGKASLTDVALGSNVGTANGNGTGIGGAIYNTSALTVLRGVFTNNSAVLGGGVFSSGAASVADSSLSGNKATFAGGGLYTGILTAADAPTLLLTNISVADSDGGLFAGGVGVGNKASLTMNGGSITGGKAITASGLYVQDGGQAAVSAASIANNTASKGNGGGVFNGGTVSLTDTSVTDNTATQDPNATSTTGLGGGIYNGAAAASTAPARLTLLRGTVGSNHAVSGAGVFTTGVAELTGATVQANVAGFAGGGVWSGVINANDAPATTLTDTNVAANSAGFTAGGIGGGNKSSTTTSGGAIHANSALLGAGAYVQEGAIGSLTRTDITDNTANAGASNFGDGAGVLNAGKLTITEATLSGNVATANPNNNSTGVGGAIYNGSNSAPTGVELTVVRSLITGNSARGASALDSLGKATLRDSTVTGNTTSFGTIVTSAPLSIVSSTINANLGATARGVYSFTANVAVVAGSIISNNGINCSGLVDAGYNLTDATDTGCGFTAANHDVKADPQLDPLADNGGPTRTEAPRAASPVINAIPSPTTVASNDAVTGSAIQLCPGADQRDVPRPQGPACDIGAVEIGNVAPTIAGPTSATFITGTANSVGFTSTGVPTPDLSATGTLPAGVTFVDNGDGTGQLAGTAAPGSHGTYPLVITASNGNAPDATINFTLTVVEPLVITTTSMPDGTVGTPYSAALAATGGTSPYTWSLLSGSLPNGLSLASDGTVSGTPTGPRGTSTFTVQVTDVTDPMQTATKTLSITVHGIETQLVAEPVLVRVAFPGLFVVSGGHVVARLTSGPAHTPVANAAVIFTVAGNPLCTDGTDAEGYATCAVSPAQTLAIVLANGFDATFRGSATLEPSSAHGPVIMVS
jgi:hypothetical protein